MDPTPLFHCALPPSSTTADFERMRLMSCGAMTRRWTSGAWLLLSSEGPCTYTVKRPGARNRLKTYTCISRFSTQEGLETVTQPQLALVVAGPWRSETRCCTRTCRPCSQTSRRPGIWPCKPHPTFTFIHTTHTSLFACRAHAHAHTNTHSQK